MAERMKRSDFLEQVLFLLLSYGGDERVLNALIKFWGIESLYRVVSKIYEEYLKEQKKDERVEKLMNENEEIDLKEEVEETEESYINPEAIKKGLLEDLDMFDE